MIAELASQAERLDRTLAERGAERERLLAELSSLSSERAGLEDLLGTGDGPLALAPLVLTLIGSVGAMGAAFATYLLGLFCLSSPYGPDSDTKWGVAGWVVALVLGAVMSAGGRRPGAGGRARVALLRMSIALLASSLAGGAVLLAIGYGAA
ncbi:MAG: hypothetical protein IT378_08940 [Sandaracinaceae bacterium]|nr:hypothetical protein [Sandaracinaceae bacterium]